MGWANPKHKGLKQEQSYYPAITWNSWVQGPIKAHVTRPHNVCWVSSDPLKFAHLFYETTLWSYHESPTYPSVCEQLGWFTQPNLWCPNHLRVEYISLSKFTLLLNKQDTGVQARGPPSCEGDRNPYMTTGKTIALTRRTFVDKVMSLLFNMLSRLVITNLMAAVTICSDFGAPQNKVSHCFHCFPIYLPWSDGTGCHDLRFLNVELKPTFSLSSFTFIKRLLSS